MAEPMRWELDDDGRPATARRDGLMFRLARDQYGADHSVLVYRESDGELIERILRNRWSGSAIRVADAWSLEEWRSRKESEALEQVAKALQDHNGAMKRLNYVRSFQV